MGRLEQETHDTERYLPTATSTPVVHPQLAIFFFQRSFPEGITIGSVS